MKRLTYLTAGLVTTIIVIATSCHSKHEPGRVYMPDMAYSRAVESYALLNDTIFTDIVNDSKHRIYYNRMPVLGTVARGELFADKLTNDSAGYAQSAAVKNPLTTPLVGKDSAEAARLFNINCAICHGAGGKGDGPIAGKIGAVANLTSAAYVAMADGTMFHSITYGKANMGSYASQLDRKQRWEIVQYIRTLQPKAAAPTAATAAVADSAKKVK